MMVGILLLLWGNYGIYENSLMLKQKEGIIT